MPVNISIQYEQEDNNKHVTSKHKSMNFYDEPCFFCVKMFDRHYYYYLFLQPRKKVVIFYCCYFLFFYSTLNKRHFIPK